MAPPNSKRPPRPPRPPGTQAPQDSDVELPFDDDEVDPLQADDPRPQRVPQYPAGSRRNRRQGPGVRANSDRELASRFDTAHEYSDPGYAPAFLYVERGPGAGQLVPVKQGALVIGRSSSSDLRLQHPSISRRHAHLTRRGERFFLKDLSSQNGTFLNRHRIASEVELLPGDEISLGNALLRLRGHGTPAHGIPQVATPEAAPPRKALSSLGVALGAAALGSGVAALIALLSMRLAGGAEDSVSPPLAASQQSASAPAAPGDGSASGTIGEALPAERSGDGSAAMVAKAGVGSAGLDATAGSGVAGTGAMARNGAATTDGPDARVDVGVSAPDSGAKTGAASAAASSESTTGSRTGAAASTADAMARASPGAPAGTTHDAHGSYRAGDVASGRAPQEALTPKATGISALNVARGTTKQVRPVPLTASDRMAMNRDDTAILQRPAHDQDATAPGARNIAASSTRTGHPTRTASSSRASSAGGAHADVGASDAEADVLRHYEAGNVAAARNLAQSANLGALHEQLVQFATAEAAARKALAKRDIPEAITQLTLALSVDDALAHGWSKHGPPLRKQLSRLHLQVGVEHAAAGRPTEARAAFEQALKHDTGNREAREHLARLNGASAP
ncbi:FHA domain-containing protein [Myxococcus sp. Y35]|uniref:FHA domain-containing protein n=1 Tax=Pseudomyxococcus flavus TaxID=3115648 RepID=UPI003CF233A6